MNSKLAKIIAEHDKNAAKISELQERQKELDKQRTEIENLDIIGLVRSMGVTGDELVAIIQSAKGSSASKYSENKEGFENEEN